MRKLFIGLVSIVMASLITANVAQAVEFKLGEDLYLDSPAPFSDDLYIAGGTVNIIQEVRGDLIVAGGQVTIDGSVSQDVIVVGGKVVINGNVGDDLRVAGGQVEVNKKINGDLLVFGGTGTLGKEGLVGGDVVMAGGSFDIKGEVGGSLDGIAGRLAILGVIGGDVDVTVNSNLIVANQAKIGGNLSYRAPNESEIKGANVQGKVEYEQYVVDTPSFDFEQIQRSLTLGYISYKVFVFFSYLLIALIFVLLVPNFIYGVNQGVRKNFWKSLGVGGLTVISLIAGILISFISGVGFLIGVVLSSAAVILFIVAQVFAGMIIGSFIVKTDKKSSKLRIFLSYLVGLIVYTLVLLIPVLGWLVGIVVYLTALGSVVNGKMEIYSALQKKKVL